MVDCEGTEDETRMAMINFEKTPEEIWRMVV